LKKETAFYENLNLLSHPFVDIRDEKLIELVQRADQVGVYVLSATGINKSEIALIVGRTNQLTGHIKFIQDKFRDSAKADYKNRYVAEQIALKCNKYIPMNFHWFPMEEIKLVGMEKELCLKYSPIFGRASQKSKCKISNQTSIIFEGQQNKNQECERIYNELS